MVLSVDTFSCGASGWEGTLSISDAVSFFQLVPYFGRVFFVATPLTSCTFPPPEPQWIGIPTSKATFPSNVRYLLLAPFIFLSSKTNRPSSFSDPFPALSPPSLPIPRLRRSLHPSPTRTLVTLRYHHQRDYPPSTSRGFRATIRSERAGESEGDGRVWRA